MTRPLLRSIQPKGPQSTAALKNTEQPSGPTDGSTDQSLSMSAVSADIRKATSPGHGL